MGRLDNEGNIGTGGEKVWDPWGKGILSPKQGQGHQLPTWVNFSGFLWAPLSRFSTPFLDLDVRSRGACSSSSAEVPEKVIR